MISMGRDSDARLQALGGANASSVIHLRSHCERRARIPVSGSGHLDPDLGLSALQQRRIGRAAVSDTEICREIPRRSRRCR
jgi:hypothetical protein